MKWIQLICVSLALASVSPVLAQTGIIPPPNLTAPAPDRVIPDAPIGHRQPRAAEVPQPQSEPGSYKATEEENARQDAALDRKIKGICKGC